MIILGFPILVQHEEDKEGQTRRGWRVQMIYNFWISSATSILPSPLQWPREWVGGITKHDILIGIFERICVCKGKNIQMRESEAILNKIERISFDEEEEGDENDMKCYNL